MAVEVTGRTRALRMAGLSASLIATAPDGAVMRRVTTGSDVVSSPSLISIPTGRGVTNETAPEVVVPASLEAT